MQGLAILDAGILFNVAYKKEQRGSRLDQHLRVVARGFEFCRARQQRRLELLGVLDGKAQRGRAEGVEVAARGVHHDEAVAGEEARHQAGEGAGEGWGGFVWLMRVALAQQMQMGAWCSRSLARSSRPSMESSRTMFPVGAA